MDSVSGQLADLESPRGWASGHPGGDCTVKVGRPKVGLVPDCDTELYKNGDNALIARVPSFVAFCRGLTVISVAASSSCPSASPR